MKQGTIKTTIISVGYSLLSDASRERNRWGLWLPLFFASGIAFYFSLYEEPSLGWITAIAVLFAVLAAWFWRNASSVLAIVIIAGTIMVLGFTLAGWRTFAVGAPVLAEKIGPASISGRVIGVERLPSALRITLDKPRLSRVSGPKTPEKVRLRLSGKQPPLVPGDWVQVIGVLNPPPPPSYPGGYDFQRRAYFQQIGAVGYGLGRVTVTGRDARPGLAVMVEQWRTGIGQRISAVLPGVVGAVATALITGDRGQIPKETMAAIRAAGLAHLLAISGLHIGLVAGIIFFATRGLMALWPVLALSYPIKKWAAVAALTGAFAYAILAGATVPTQRAFLMIGLVLVAVLVDRRGISLRLVAWAAMVILIFRPESLMSASFQLSFAAVTALIAVYEAISRPDRKRTASRSVIAKGAAYLGGVALSTLIASAATAPFALYHFNHLSLYGVAANLVAVPLTALWIMPWAVTALLLMPLGLEQAPLHAMGWGIDGILATANGVAHWTGAHFYLPALPDWGLAVVVFGGLWLCIWRRRWRYAGGIAIVGGLASVVTVTVPDILVSGDGRLMAVKTEQGNLTFNTRRLARFTREKWLVGAGLSPDKSEKWPRFGASGDTDFACDGSGCVLTRLGRTVSLVHHPAALAEDCWSSDVLISSVPLRHSCPSPQRVVDRFALWRDGAHAVWLEKDGIRLENVNAERGHRPWVLRRGPKS